MKGSQPIILNGERVLVVTKTSDKPRWIPGFVWRWMVRTVVKAQTVTVQRER